jgi:hypothetical protein
MTCNCRFCGYIVCYSVEDIGREIPCSRCSQYIRLPGKLVEIATLKRMRRKDNAGIAMEIGGFLLMFILFPWGFMAGVTVLYFGWRKSTALMCSACGTVVHDNTTGSCPKCRSNFGIE